MFNRDKIPNENFKYKYIERIKKKTLQPVC